ESQPRTAPACVPIWPSSWNGAYEGTSTPLRWGRPNSVPSSSGSHSRGDGLVDHSSRAAGSIGASARRSHGGEISEREATGTSAPRRTGSAHRSGVILQLDVVADLQVMSPDLQVLPSRSGR